MKIALVLKIPQRSSKSPSKIHKLCFKNYQSRLTIQVTVQTSEVNNHVILNSVQSLSHVQLFATPWIAACQISLSITNSWSLLKLMSIEAVMPCNHLILCWPLLLPPSIFPSTRVFSESQFFASGGQSTGVSASTPIFPMNIQDLFPLRWTDLISLQSKGLSRVFSNTSSKASILRHSTFFIVQLTSVHDYWKNHRVD